MGLLSHHASRVKETSPIIYDGPMARWEPGARERLVLAAVDLFTEQGYDATTVAQIAERAGVTKSTFFRHFPDKRDLLVAGQQTLSGLLVEGIAAAPASATPLEAVAAGLERASGAMGPMNRELGPRVKAAIAANAELQERDALKSVGMAAAMTQPWSPVACRTRPRISRASWDVWRSSAATPSGPRATATPTTTRQYTLAALDELRAASASLG